MSVWNSFKKKLNETWSGADFWDQKENQQQRQQFAQANQPQQTQQPTSNNGGGLRVVNAPSNQTITIDQPDYSNKQITVQQAAPAEPKDPINAGLDAGKSWEQIAQETGANQADVAEYSKATRPNYGVARIAKPQQSNWNKFRDVLDTNTEADKWRRQEGNDNRPIDTPEKAIVQERSGNVIGNTIGAIPKMANTIAAQFPQGFYAVQGQFAANESNAAMEGLAQAKKTGDPRSIAFAQARFDKASARLNDATTNNDIANSMFQKNNGGLFNTGTIYDKKAAEEGSAKGARDILLTTGEGMLDVASLGLTSVAGKSIAKVGVKQALKEGIGIGTKEVVEQVAKEGVEQANKSVIKKILGKELLEKSAAREALNKPFVKILSTANKAPIISNAIVNATQGGSSAARQDGSATDILKSALISGTVGTAADLGLAGVGAGIYKGKNALRSMFEGSPNVKINLPEGDVPKPTIKINNGTGADVLQTPRKPGDPLLGAPNPNDIPVVSIKRADGRLEQYQPKTREEYVKYQNMIDENRIANGAPDNGIAGMRDTNGDTYHISSGEQVKNNYTPIQDAPTPNVQRLAPDGSPMPVQKPNSTQKLSDLFPNLGDRKALLTTPVDDLKKAHPDIKPDVVDRLVRDYGEEQTRNILASTRDASNIRDMNGFVISEARKRYGEPNVRIQGSDMSPEELASLEQSAPPLKVGEAPEVPPVRVEQPVEAPPVRMEAPVEAPPVRVEPPVIDPNAPQSNLGNIAQDFYDSRVGNQRIKYRDLERLGQDVSKQVDTDFKAIGTTFQDVARKVQEGVRNGAKTLDEAGLTPAEAQILRNAQEEMNYVRRRASTGKREVGGKDLGEMYLPNQKEGQYGGENLFEGFRKEKPGNEFKRKNKIDLEDLDYSPNVIGEYVTRYGDTKLYKEERLARALTKANPDVDEERIAAGVSKLIGIQDKVNTVRTKIGAFGFGLRSQVDDAGKYIDTSKEMSDLGLELGHGLDIVDQPPHGLTNGDRINSVVVNGEKLGDRLGLNQYRDAQSYAAKQFTDAGTDRQALADAVSKHLQQNYNLHPDDLEYAVGGISRMSPALPDEVVLAKVTSTYQQAAKQQLLEELQHVDITNPKLRKDVSSLTNQILREGSIESQLSNKVVSKILQTQNAIFRKLNVSSALNELGDLASFTSAYGKGTAYKPDFSTISEFGLGEIDAAIAPYVKALGEGKGLKEVLSSINDKTNLYKFVEHYKAGVVATSAKNRYLAQGISGDQLTKRVLEDYRTLALPVDAFTKTFLDNAPLYTQYMTWGIRNLQKEGKLATGKISSGVLEDMSTKQRIARNAYANLPAKTVFWLASNGLKGTSILTAFGLTDFTGLSNGDFSGISEDDKSWFDKTTNYTNSSTTLSMLNSIIQSVEKEQLKNSDKYKNADYNPYAKNDLDKDIMNKFTPSFIKNVTGTNELMEKGYSENKDGKVQYEAPTDFYNIAKSYLFGKAQTDNARDYSGRQGILDREGNPIKNVKDMALEQTNVQQGNYTRPLNEDYSKAYKAADEAGKKAMLQGGRAYNGFLDNLKKNDPKSYDNYLSSLDGNHVSPEYWKTMTGGGNDLTAFNALKGRSKQKVKDLGGTYDPIYDLPDNQAKAVLQQKSTATGDDIALRNSLYKEQWFKDYMDKTKSYYQQKEQSEGGQGQTSRVVDWYALNDQYTGMKALTTDDGKTPDWATKYPTVYQQKAISDKFGFDSDQSKNFFKASGDAYKAEKANYDSEQLNLINKMREIEGYPAMSAEQYAQVSNVKKTDDKKTGGSGGGSGEKKVAIQTGDYGSARGLTLPSAKIKVSKVKTVAKYTPKKVKIQRSKAKM